MIFKSYIDQSEYLCSFWVNPVFEIGFPVVSNPGKSFKIQPSLCKRNIYYSNSYYESKFTCGYKDRVEDDEDDLGVGREDSAGLPVLLQDPDCLPEAEVEHWRRVVEAVRGEVVVAVLVVTKVHASPRDVTGREHVNAVTIDALETPVLVKSSRQSC